MSPPDSSLECQAGSQLTVPRLSLGLLSLLTWTQVRSLRQSGPLSHNATGVPSTAHGGAHWEWQASQQDRHGHGEGQGITEGSAAHRCGAKLAGTERRPAAGQAAETNPTEQMGSGMVLQNNSRGEQGQNAGERDRRLGDTKHVETTMVLGCGSCSRLEG